MPNQLARLGSGFVTNPCHRGLAHAAMLEGGSSFGDRTHMVADEVDNVATNKF